MMDVVRYCRYLNNIQRYLQAAKAPRNIKLRKYSERKRMYHLLCVESDITNIHPSRVTGQSDFCAANR